MQWFWTCFRTANERSEYCKSCCIYGCCSYDEPGISVSDIESGTAAEDEQDEFEAGTSGSASTAYSYYNAIDRYANDSDLDAEYKQSDVVVGRGCTSFSIPEVAAAIIELYKGKSCRSDNTVENASADDDELDADDNVDELDADRDAELDAMFKCDYRMRTDVCSADPLPSFNLLRDWSQLQVSIPTMKVIVE